MIITGKALIYGDNIDTDVIIPARYLNSFDPQTLASHAMADFDADFAAKAKERGILAAGFNFGCGSSREHAPIALLGSGIKCVIAKSFARIFFRNAINIGLVIIESEKAAERAEEGNSMTIDTQKGAIINHNKEEEYPLLPFPPFLQKIIDSGGLLKMAAGDEKLKKAGGGNE